MLFIYDMDGVLYRGNEPVPYAAQAVARMREAGHIVRFLTNNAARPRARYIPKLEALGIHCTVDEVVTSAHVAALYFRAQGWEGASVYVIGMDGIREELVNTAGCRLVETDEEHADAVVVSIDRGFTYEKMRIAQQHILRGAHFICTNRDPTFPVEGGRVVPGAGSVVAGVVTATGREPINMGKPNDFSIRMLARETGTPLSETVVIGDRLDTDIAAAHAAGVKSLLVLTGVTTRAEAEAAIPEETPDIIVDDLSHLPAEWLSVPVGMAR